MHIEPGLVAAAKVAAANTLALGLLASQAKAFVRQPHLIVRSLLASVFFTLCMQAFHLPVGPSELHFLGAMPIYLTLGFVPALFGFAGGLMLQGVLFAPTDLAHLGVNFLSLAIPLATVHFTLGRRIDKLSPAKLFKLDAAFYSGVTLMVGFWLAISEVAVPVAAWASFAAAYGSMVLAEPVLTWVLLRALDRSPEASLLRRCFDLRLA